MFGSRIAQLKHQRQTLLSIQFVFFVVHRRVRHNDLIKINGVGVFQRIVPHVR
jgi:hypothetical protein